MPFYLLEIGCEEIPASFVSNSASFLKSEFEKQLNSFGLPVGNIVTGGTPKRLYVYLDNLAKTQADKTEIITGPPANIAFDDSGNLTAVGLKFAESKGLDLATVKKVSMPKGEYLQGEKKTGGSLAENIIKDIVPNIINSIPFTKSMRWGNGDFRFARPVHNFLSIYDGKLLDFQIDGISATTNTVGHRFLAPKEIQVKSYDEYKTNLEKAYVIVDIESRKNIIINQAKQIEKDNNFTIQLDDELLETVTNLVEYPHLILGSFDEAFLDLPKEVLVTSMKVHQKYFPVEKDGKLINKFVGVSNMVSDNGDDLIRQGYERVLRARLNDANFFFNNDKKVPLSTRVESLKKVVYQEKLGTSYEKMERFSRIAEWLNDNLNLNNKDNILKVAQLAKADLMSEMVYEFPELQGLMGSYYAKFEGNSDNICKGIFDHYLPRFAGDDLPTTIEGSVVSIADKLDTICGAFAAGMIPTGNLDPYGLRRSAIGILSIIENLSFRIDFRELIEFSLSAFEEKVKFHKTEVTEKVLNFIMQRWKQQLVVKGVTDSEIFDAVIDKSPDPVVIMNLSSLLYKERNSQDFQTIAGSFKRINNILKKNNWTDIQYNISLFQSDEEKIISHLIDKQNITSLLENEEYNKALEQLLMFAPAVNDFFDKVMVMAEDEEVRGNRLSLIACLRRVFMSIGNFDSITIKDK